jgi:hypothetical protein
MRILLTTASFGTPLRSYWELQQSERHDICYRRYNDVNFPFRDYSLTPVLKSKFVKMLAHEMNPGYDLYVWMDATFSLYRTDAADAFAAEIRNAEIALYRHDARSSIMTEARQIGQFIGEGFRRMVRRAGDEPVMEQAQHYCSDEAFADDSLYNGGIIVYRPSAAPLMRDWYGEVCRWSVRDQISLPYVIHRHRPHLHVIEGSIYHNKIAYYESKLFGIE